MANKFQLELIEQLNKLEEQRDYLASRMSGICRVCRGSIQRFCNKSDCIAVDYEQISTEDWIEESKKEHPPKI